MKIKAFTLAEVLITLGVIGVIAAITIPMLITKYQKFQTVTRLKGTYSQIAQAIRLSQDDNGDVEGWDLASADWFDRYLANYMKVTKARLKDLNEEGALVYKELSGNRETGFAIINNAVYGGATSYTLLNGVQLMVADTYRVQANSAGIFIDINGDKGPNTVQYTYKGGRRASDFDSDEKRAQAEIEPDIYAFALLETGRICPIGIPEFDKDVMTARFAYYDNDGEPLYTSKSLAYYQAKGAAWGYYNADGPNVLNFNIDEPFTLNDIIRQKLSGSKLVEDFPADLSSLSPVATAKEDPYHCSNTDLESCYVFLDSYRQF